MSDDFHDKVLADFTKHAETVKPGEVVRWTGRDENTGEKQFVYIIGREKNGELWVKREWPPQDVTP